MVGLEQRPLTFIEMQESAKRPNIRFFLIADDTTIQLSGITDYKWKIYEPLLNALRATRKQTESGEIQITPLAYEIVRKFFPENASKNSMFFTVFRELNKALAPNGWSVVREGQGPKKPVGAPWFLKGPNDNGVKAKGVLKVPKQDNMSDSTDSSTKEKKRALERAVEEFDRIAFGTSLLRLCLSSLTRPDAKESFTKNPGQAMSILLPPGLKLQDIIGEKTPQEYFQESIRMAVNSMAGKTYEELSEKQKPIMPFWNKLKIDSGQRPDMVIFQHFSGPNSNEPLGETSRDNDSGAETEEKVILKRKSAGGRLRGKNKKTS